MRMALAFSQSQAFFSIDLKVRRPKYINNYYDVPNLFHIVHVDGTLTRRLFAYIDVSGNYNFSYAPGESEAQVYPGKCDLVLFP